jgi:ribosomal protein L5
MNDLREQVQKVVRDAWPQFQLNHPHLAAAMDEIVLTDQISQSLADDPEFQQALHQAETVGQTAQTIIAFAKKAISAVVSLRLSPD